MRTRVAFLAVAAAAALAIAPSTHAAGGWAAGYGDAAGDSGTAPDITEVDVGSDDNGQITIVVYAPNATTDHASIESVYIDTDSNPAVGDPQAYGADVAFDAFNVDHTFEVDRWNQSTQSWEYDDAFQVDVVSNTSARSFTFNRTQIGNAYKIRVFAETVASVDEYGAGHYDDAPDQNVIEYDVMPLTLTPTFRATGTKAGKGLGLAMTVTRSDTGTLLTDKEGTVTCFAGSGALKLQTQMSGFLTLKDTPVATCGWVLPKKLKGKLVKAMITVSFGGKTVTKAVSFRAR